MKKIFTIALMTTMFIGAFAFDTENIIPNGTIKSYIKTDYAVTSKFDVYYRTPEAKFVHNYNIGNLEVENIQYSETGAVVDRLVYKYDMNNRIVSKTLFNADAVQQDNMVYVYDSVGNLTSIDTYAKDGVLKAKTIFKIFEKKYDVTDYNENGAITKKTVSFYNDSNNVVETKVYNGEGLLVQRTAFSYDANSLVSEISTFNARNELLYKDVNKYETGATAPSEIQTFDNTGKLITRKIIKYDTNDNISKTTTYNIVEKFGETLTELADIVEYSYQY